MSFYRHHIFFCTNQREGAAACGQHGAQTLCDYAKHRLAALGPFQSAGIRVSRAGCLARCAEGPTVVVYPEAVWYTYLDTSDIDEIIEEHILNGRVVTRLRLTDIPRR